ncbi:hypothetical protein B0H19DRAFT_1187131 [Mycena capillaripes]|nr:hypothetical protein B0H19DRAFT_1186867 [Mycena capillaripes]KAJ6533161.1 hypothetical protein B0H19DRAFT_1187131 [Mycena capillaripes]
MESQAQGVTDHELRPSPQHSVINQQPTPTPAATIKNDQAHPSPPNSVVTQQPAPTPAPQLRPTDRTNSKYKYVVRPTPAEVASAIVCCPVKCPVCCCDFMCHACYVVLGPCCLPDGSVDGILYREAHEPGCCTQLVSVCCPRRLCPCASACFNRQEAEEENARTRMALCATEIWCRAAEKEGCVYYATMALTTPCWLPLRICVACQRSQ